MSDKPPTSNALKKFLEDIEKVSPLEQKRTELQEKKLLVDHFKYTNELEKITKNQSDLERSSNVNVGILTDEEIKEIQLQNKIYLDGAKSGMLFLNQSFHKLIPAWSGSIILVGSRTGGGKSTATANLIYSTMTQINPLTGKNRKVLTISCEETAIQVYNRLTCLYKGYNFNEQDEFTEEQKETLIDFSGKWPAAGITVIGEDGHGRTDSIEGIKSIFENLIKTGTHYDLILIDYIQKITTSKKNPSAQQYTVLKDVMGVLDHYKNIYPATIVVMSQLSSQSAGDPENQLDFQDRLRGCKDIITPCTVALEMVPDIQNLKTDWIIRKNRYKGSTVGGTIKTAYDRGHFKVHTDEWAKEVAQKRENKEHSEGVGKFVKPETKEIKEEK